MTTETKPGHVHHWKHGWIPIGDFAALTKEHGSQKNAAAFLDKSNAHHGTTSPTPSAPHLSSVGATTRMEASAVRQGDIIHVPSALGGATKRLRVDTAYPPQTNGIRNVDVTNIDTGRAMQISLQGDGQTHTVERKK